MACAMQSGPKFPRAGGALLAASILAGVVAGAFAGEPSVGFVAGLAVGLLLLGLVWLADRRR